MVNLVPSKPVSRAMQIGGVRVLGRSSWLATTILLLLSSAATLPAQESATAKPPVANKRLDSRTKIKLVAAVAALVILGFGLVAMTYLGGKWTRRIVNAPPSDRWEDATSLVRDDWANKPLTPEERHRLFGSASPR